MHETMQKVLQSGVWGTIGPHSVSAAEALAKYTGGAYGLLCHSRDAAYESLLRAFGARLSAFPHGDCVIVGEVCVPSDALIPLAVGADPVFCVQDETTGLPELSALQSLLKNAAQPIRAAVVDYLPECVTAAALRAIYEACHACDVPLIVNAGGYIGAKCESTPLSTLCDAVVYTLGQGSAIDVGMGGLVVTDDESILQNAFAYHNCGRGFGAGCSLVMDDILGGDLRVTEWTAAAAETVLKNGAQSVPVPPARVPMKDQPIFQKR